MMIDVEEHFIKKNMCSPNKGTKPTTEILLRWKVWLANTIP